jgi:hypothetical protein
VDYILHDHTLERVPGNKYVGVYTSQNDHIDQTTAKAYRLVGFLQRNLSSCPQDVKAQAYTRLVLPVLEYTLSMWDPYHQQQVQQIEQVQHQAARFATGNDRSRDPECVTNMLNRLALEPLQHRRARNKVIMLYKITNYLVEVPVHHLIQYTTNNTRGSSSNIRQITTRIDIDTSTCTHFYHRRSRCGTPSHLL